MKIYPKVSVIVTTWLEESKKYLDACMASLTQLNYPKECLEIILVGKPSYAPVYLGIAKTCYPEKDQFGNSEGINFGVSKSDPDSKYILSINDDTILTRNSLINMVESAGDADIIINPISPCDNTVNYNLNFTFRHYAATLQLHERFYRYEQLSQFIPSLIAADSPYPQGLIRQDHLCMFASLIPRSVWNKLGPLDENFKTGPDDIDYSYRAKEAGIHLAVELSALIWHFGGPTSELTLDDAKRAANDKYFEEKWGKRAPHAVGQ